MANRRPRRRKRGQQLPAAKYNKWTLIVTVISTVTAILQLLIALLEYIRRR